MSVQSGVEVGKVSLIIDGSELKLFSETFPFQYVVSGYV